MNDDDRMRQAKMTACEFLDAASEHIFGGDSFPHTFDNCIRLAALMAKDFDTMRRSADSEELVDALKEIDESLMHIAGNTGGVLACARTTVEQFLLR